MPSHHHHANYAFLITLADEGVPQLESCLGFLRAAYPHAPVRVISDGAPDPGYKAACKRHGADYVEGQYLKRIECGGRWWRRFLEVGLRCGTSHIVKLDPDARFHRPFRGHPPFPICGTLEGRDSDRENIQGGCQVIAADAARRILFSSHLDSPHLRDSKAIARDDAHYRWLHSQAYFSTDHSLMWLARNCGIATGNWCEVGSKWRPPPPVGDYAVTHPHKIECRPRHREAPLRVITTCKGRLNHLKETLPTWLENGVSVTVVDYACPDGTARWVRTHYPQVKVVRVRHAPRFNLSKARNLGAHHSPPGWFCFFDADWLCKEGWADAVRGSLKSRHYHLADPIAWGQFGSVILEKSSFTLAGGYDPLFKAWGWEDGDFYARLRHAGIRPSTVPGRFFSSIKHDEAERTKFYDIKKVSVSRDFYSAYVKLKVEFMLDLGRLPSPAECRALLLETCDILGVDPEQFVYGAEVDSTSPDVEDTPLDVEVTDPAKPPIDPTVDPLTPPIYPVGPGGDPANPDDPDDPAKPDPAPASASSTSSAFAFAYAPQAAAPAPTPAADPLAGAPRGTFGDGMAPVAATDPATPPAGEVSKSIKLRRPGSPTVNISVVVQNVGEEIDQRSPNTETGVR